MKKFKRVLLLIVVAVVLASMLVPSLTASALVPYTTYTYGVNGLMQTSPHAYDPTLVISSATIKKGLDDNVNDQATLKYGETWKDISKLADVCVDNLGYVYLVDSGTNRIIGLDRDYNLRLVIDEFVNDMGVPDSLSGPSGCFVTDTEILVADTEKARIVIFDKVGNFKEIVPEPSSDVMPENSVYRPTAVATDTAGRIYVVSKTTNYGVIALRRDGTFLSFIGPQKVVYNAFQLFLRMFQTQEQIKKSVKFVPVEYNNLTIDSDGFLYVTTNAIDKGQQQSAINSKSKLATYAPVKKLNPSGNDVMNRNGFYPPSGEVDVLNGAVSGTNGTVSATGASDIVDVALGPNGMWSIIDQKRSRVFTYDDDGKLLFAFGDKGDQVGQIQDLKALAYQDTNLLLMDATANTVTVYSRTAYGDLLAKALQNTQDQNYSLAVDYYISILQRNNNFDAAYIGIADSLYRDGEFNDAMQYYKSAYDTANYSKAYSQYRKEWVEDWVLIIPVVIIAACVLVSLFFRYANKVNKAGHVYKEKRTLKEELLYAFHIIFHPFDGFWDLKHEKRGGVRGATIILGATILVFLYQAVGRGYLYNPNGARVDYFMQICYVAVPVFLWVTSNWCLTTLFDGEGSFKDIYIATCYSLTPLPILILPTVWLSNIVTVDEMSLLALVSSIAFVWFAFLVFFAMMVTHDYTLGKNILTIAGTIVAAAFIMFVAILFSTLLGKIFTFGYNIYVELALR